MEKEGVVITQEQHPDIYNWLSENVKYYEEYQNQYTLTSEGKINAYWNLLLHDDVTQIKYPFGYVKGNFDCSKCKKLQSLICAPKEVGGRFCCSECRSLTSLIGVPEKVGGYFNCYNCDSITSLIGAPEKIEGSFHCGDCRSLTSLIGLPKHINGEFLFRYNNFSNNPKYKEEYKLYLAMWLELFESVNNEERLEYINSYKNKTDVYNEKTIIPIEILKEYGF
jgi:hypothetical protein